MRKHMSGYLCCKALLPAQILGTMLRHVVVVTVCLGLSIIRCIRKNSGKEEKSN